MFVYVFVYSVLCINTAGYYYGRPAQMSVCFSGSPSLCLQCICNVFCLCTVG